MTRRTIIASLLMIALLMGSTSAQAPAAFKLRGYYITFMRMPTYGLEAWKQTVDCIEADGGNTLLLWMGGGFRSKKFPITWKYNADHRNVQKDFVGELIDYAHTKKIRVLLCLTPFAYDGVNQYPLEHPELTARQKNGKPVGMGGIHCWGYNLCPSNADAQQFMLDYAREMAFDFYPNADGLMIESSDYAICQCPDCGEKFFEKEFAFVRQISAELWGKKPDATVMVYPHYFSGATVPGFGVKAAKLEFDPRWSLFFTPHSAHFEANLIRKAKDSVYSDDSPALHNPGRIQAAAQTARKAGVSGYVPSLEAFSFVPYHEEEGQKWLIGKRQIPCGFGWLKEDQMPYNELPMRVNRLAFREFSRDPDLPFEQFKYRLAGELLGQGAAARAADDLLELQRLFFGGRTWCQPSPMTSPEAARHRQAGGVKPQTLADWKAGLGKFDAIESRYRNSALAGERELANIARWVQSQWTPENRRILDPQ